MLLMDMSIYIYILDDINDVIRVVQKEKENLLRFT